MRTQNANFTNFYLILLLPKTKYDFKKVCNFGCQSMKKAKTLGFEAYRRSLGS